MKFRAIISVLVLVYSPAAAQESGNESALSSAALLAEARTALRDSDYTAAITSLDAALAVEDIAAQERAVAHYLRGVAYYRQDYALAALGNLRAALAYPELPDAMRKSATASTEILAAQVATMTGGILGTHYTYQTELTRRDLELMEAQLDSSRGSEKDPYTRSEQYAVLAHEYASRGEYVMAKLMAAKTIEEARASGSQFRMGAAHMTHYVVAQMQDDEVSSSRQLSHAIAAFETAEALLTLPSYLTTAIEHSDGRRDRAETCRHRKNLDRIYVRIDSNTLAQDSADNREMMDKLGCS